MGDLSSLKKIESGQEVVRPFSAYNLKRNDAVKSVDKTPFLFRPIPPLSTPYIREKLVGASMAWNQLVSNGNFASGTDWTKEGGEISFSNNICTYTPTSYTNKLMHNIDAIANHVYYIMAKIKANDANSRPVMYEFLSSSGTQYSSSTPTSWATLGGVIKPTSLFSVPQIQFRNMTAGSVSDATIQIKNVYLIDLTLAFSPAIADRIYSMEQAQAGSGIAWIKSYGFLTDDYYANDGGSIQSVCADRKEIVGFNQFDKSTAIDHAYIQPDGEVNTNGSYCVSQPIPVLPNTLVYFKDIESLAHVRPIAYYDQNMNFISTDYITTANVNHSSGLKRMPNNTYFVRISCNPNYLNSVCVNISDSDRNGTYEPYHKTTISLGHDELRGVMQLDANNNLVYYGDEKTSDGVIDRKFGIVDLGDQTWTYDSTYTRFYATISNLKNTTARTLTMICGKYVCIDDGREFANIPDKSIYNMTTKVYIHDSSYNDATAFTTAMSGIYLVYPLDTPTTEQSTPFESPQYLFDGGTEEFIDYGVEQETRDVAVPVGHVTEYMGASDGTEIKDKFYLPTFPQNDGEYLLKIKKQNGVVADMSWVAQHYSTDEQIIGTWIDGKPLYEKTFTYSGSSILITPSVWTTIPFAEVIPNISYFFHTMVTTDCSENRIRFKYDGGYLKAAAVDDLNISQLVVTIRYTKTSS